MNALKQIGEGVSLQSRSLWKVLFVIYLPVVLLFLVVGLLSRVLEELTLALLMRDILITARLPVFTGLVPQLEAILWSASLTVCAVAWVVLQRRGDDYASAKRFLLHCAIVTAVLLFDDVFLFHGEIAPKNLNIDKRIVLSSYLVMIGVFMYLNRWEILNSEYLILMLALGLFASSVFLDLLPLQALPLHRFVLQVRVFLEDGFKFAGIASWLAYFGRYAVQQIEAILGSAVHPDR